MEVEEDQLVATEPPKIHRLDASVVNRIAAGEVIQRPVSAVKELVENSLDALSSSINVVVKDGGLKLIQVSDDGHGIRYEDLPILCERHTTSKLSSFEDLQSIKSMGFRGEALASMTYVAHVTVTTITKGQLHGYRVSYKDGVMENEPKACAAVKGTQIMIENLFYNMSARRKNLQNSADDYSKIVDLLSRFAIHHTSVSFSCRKHGAGRADVSSVATLSRIDAIRSVYGVSVARSLMKVEASDEDPSSSVFQMEGFISNSEYVAKKITMVLFINDRLVDCTALKRALEIVYAATLPKASKPFIYMSIVLPPEHVDVNVHPTKREVSLLNQEVIIEKIQSVVESRLRSSNETQIFQEQTVEPLSSSQMISRKDSNRNPSPSGSKSQKVPVNKMVRTDSSDPAGRLHIYLQPEPHGQLIKNTSLTAVRSFVRQRRNPKETADLTSIHELIVEIDRNCHSGMLDIVRHCTYIGMTDDVFALLQHDTHLYLANVVSLSKELMYQQVLRRFAHFNAIQLSNPAPLKELIVLALKEGDTDPESTQNDELNEKIAEMNTELLKQKADLIEEYFSIHIDKDGNLSRLPVILDQYTPDMDRVPEFALCLANDVDWEEEKDCLQVISAALGNFYAMHPPMLPNPSGDGLQFYQKRKSFRNDEGSLSCNTGLKHCPKCIPLWLSLANLEEKMNGLSKARAVLTTARKKNSRNPELWLAAIKAELLHGNKREADNLMAKALQEQECPKSGILWAAYIGMVPYPERKIKCRDAYSYCGLEDPHVNAAVAELLWQQRKVVSARSRFELAVLHAPDIGDFWISYYKFELGKGTEETQNDVLERCRAAQPKHGEKWQTISKAVENWQQPTEAILKKAARKDAAAAANGNQQ